MTDYVVHEEEYKGLIIKIYPDEDPCMNPVEDWDMLGKQVYWHRRYTLGHEQPNGTPNDWFVDYLKDNWKDIEQSEGYENWCEGRGENEDEDVDTYIDEWMANDLPLMLKYFEKNNLLIPVYAYEHGGITISTGRFTDPFDSGQFGFVYVSHKDIIKEYGDLSKENMEKAETVLNAEVREYDSYLRGEVYGYRVFEDIDGEAGDELESCWGFIGDYNYCLEEAKSHADWWAKKFEEEQKELDRRMQG